MPLPTSSVKASHRRSNERVSSPSLSKHLSLDIWSDGSTERSPKGLPPLSTTTSSSSCHIREAFWMKLLEEQAQMEGGDSFVQTVDDDDQSAEEDFLSRRATLVGREIGKTWSVGGRAADESPLSISSAINGSDGANDGPGRQNAVMVSPMPTSKTPASHRSFGDVTNNARFKTVQSPEPSKVASRIESWEGNADKQKQNDNSWTINKSANKIEALSPSKPEYLAAPEITTSKLSTPARNTMKKYLTPSPSQPPSSCAKRTNNGRKMETVGPNPEDKNTFRWAYETWLQAGLMKQHCKYDSKNSSFWQHRHDTTIQKSLAYLSPEFTNKNEKANDTEEQRASGPIFALPSVHKMSAAPDAEPPFSSSDDEADECGFQQILDMWRDQSKAKRTDQTDSTMNHVANGRQTTGQSTRSAIDVRSTIASFSKKESVVNMQSKDMSAAKTHGAYNSVLPSPKFGELSAISVVSSEIVPYTSESNSMTSNCRWQSERSFAMSGIYDHDQGGTSSRALVILQNSDQTFDVVSGETVSGTGEHLVVRNIQNLAGTNNSLDGNHQCECSKSVFSGNDDLISFFLPQMGMACTCGRQRRGLVNPDDPTSIENVLRPWQCEFLKSFGIYQGEQLVKAKHRSTDILAKALRQWRRKNDMAPFKTSACAMALNIWAKTCKAYVRSIRKQIQNGIGYLVEHEPRSIMNELSVFLKSLPDAPTKQDTAALCEIEPESQVEV